MARIYVASSWRNKIQPSVVQRLRYSNHQVYDFRNPFNGIPGFSWSEVDANWKNWTANEYIDQLVTNTICDRGFMSDFRAMQWANTCVLVLPSGRSAHLEAGWFCGQGKRCIILTQDGEEPELMALLATEICSSIDEVINLLNFEKSLEKRD